MKHVRKQLFFRWALAALCLCTPGLLFADIGIGFTGGPGEYRQQTFNVDLHPAKPLTLGLGFTQTASSTTATTKMYSFSGAWHLRPQFSLGLSGYVTPEVDQAKSSGFGINGSYSIDTENVSWGLNLNLARNTYDDSSSSTSVTTTTSGRRGRVNQTTVTSQQWQSTQQVAFEPSLDVMFFDRFGCTAALSLYSYDSVTKNTRSGRKISYTQTTATDESLLYGYPDRTGSLGLSWWPLDSVKLSAGLSRTRFIDGQPDQSSWSLGTSYIFRSTIRFNALFEKISNGDQYITAGCRWLW